MTYPFSDRPEPKRYAELIGLVEKVKPETIVEIGVWKGKRACQMAAAALSHNPFVVYTGFDLFEEATDETNEAELNAKRNIPLVRVTETLNRFKERFPGFSFQLIKGNTRETLAGEQICADFVFIDGGHSVDTIRSDYEAVKSSPVVVFDDYYSEDDAGNLGVNLNLVGANRLVEELIEHKAVEIIHTGDKLKGGGCVDLAVVTERT